VNVKARLLIALPAVVAATVLPASSAGAAPAAKPDAAAVIPPLYKNCTNFNKKYRHGLGKLRAVDKTSSAEPVANFARSTRLYVKAMSFNRGLDRDKDGIACEKA
jgi:Excalibur calcium-binding domain